MAFEKITDDERADLPLGEFMELGAEPKGWDRGVDHDEDASAARLPGCLAGRFHPPVGANKVRLVADCLTIGAAFALLIYFPLMMIGFMSTSDQTNLILGTMLTVGLGTAILVFLVAIADERAFRAELEP